MDSIFEFIILGIDAVLLPLLYYSYRQDDRKIKNIENVIEIDLNNKSNQIKLPKVIDYAIISGNVQPKNIDIQSNYKMKTRGVIKLFSIKQHGVQWRNRSNRTNSETDDFSRNISKTINFEPFYLNNKKTNIKTEIINATQADYLFQDLETTYKHYEPLNQSFLSALLTSAIQKEVTTGVEITEKMLKNDTYLFAYGKLEKITDNIYKLTKPTNSDYPFILTKQDRNSIINDLKLNRDLIKTCFIICGSIGLATGIYVLYKQYKNYKEKKLREKMANDLRIERLRVQRERLQNYDYDNNSNNSNNNNIADQTCVLCLVNPREIVLLDCGHICLCIDCLDRLNNRKCPICRQDYQSYARCYMP